MWRSVAFALIACSTASVAMAATVTVTSTATSIAVDDAVTLYEAIQSINTGVPANADVVPVGDPFGTDDRIEFNIPGLGQVHTISISQANSLNITRTVVIDGFTQPGAVFGAPLIELQKPGNVPPDFNGRGLYLDNVSNCVIRGLIVNGFGFIGIYVVGGGNNRIQGNFVGVDPTGTAARANFHGVQMQGQTGGFVGTDGDGNNDANEGNVISGNQNNGLYVIDSVGTRVAGNMIGTDAAAAAAVPNGANGVSIGGSTDTMVGTNGDGDSDAFERNIISGNTGRGVRISGSNSSSILVTTGTRIAGNIIGADSAGTQPIPNRTGVRVDGTAGQQTNTIIGSNGDGSGDAVEGNLISGNLEDGIEIADAPSIGVRVVGNRIGIAEGGGSLGNLRFGIQVRSGATAVTIGAAAGTGNEVAFNAKGLVVADQSMARITRNSIHHNVVLGIDLANDGVTVNDTGDVDAGPNELLNFPVLVTAMINAAHLEIAGFARPGSEIELFAAEATPTGFGSGRTPLTVLIEGGPADLDATSGSYASPINGLMQGSDATNRFRFLIPATALAGVAPGSILTATATAPASNVTSEFSGNVTVAAAQADVGITMTGPAAAIPGRTVTYRLTVTNNGPSIAYGVRIEDAGPTGAGLFAAGGGCPNFPCTIPQLAPGASVVVDATFQVPASPSGGSLSNTATVSLAPPAVDPVPGNNTAVVSSAIASDIDTDGDGMPDAWETCVGLNPSVNDAAEDPDADGRTNLQESADQTHPRGFVRRYLAEGASNAFFKAQVLLLNLDVTATARVLARLQPEGGAEVSTCFPVAPQHDAAIDLGSASGLALLNGRPFALLIESDVALAADRRMTWSTGGEHSATASPGAATTWYFAEGSTTGAFRTYYLLQNPGLDPINVEVTFLTPSAVVRTYTIAPRNRFTIDTAAIPELVGADISAIVRVVGPGLVAAARSMYRDADGQPFVAGASANGASSPSLSWFFAEGSAGAFFSHYLLLFNPNAAAANAELTFLRSSGAPVVRPVTVPAMGRLTIRVADLDPALAATSSAARVSVTNGVPIVAERSMWWQSDPSAGPTWYEGHAESGASSTAPQWAFTQRELEPGAAMYLLIANHGDTAGQVQVTLTYEDGSTSVRMLPVAGQSRATLEMSSAVPEAVGRRFHIAVDGGSLPLVAERSTYRSSGNRIWSSGSGEMGTPRP